MLHWWLLSAVSQAGKKKKKHSAGHHIHWMLWPRWQLALVKWLHRNLHGDKDLKRGSTHSTPCSAVCPLAWRPWGEGWLSSSLLLLLPSLFSLFIFILTLRIIETICLIQHSFICGFLYWSPTTQVSLLSLLKRCNRVEKASKAEMVRSVFFRAFPARNSYKVMDHFPACV